MAQLYYQKCYGDEMEPWQSLGHGMGVFYGDLNMKCICNRGEDLKLIQSEASLWENSINLYAYMVEML
jgi:hypothetical protein